MRIIYQKKKKRLQFMCYVWHNVENMSYMVKYISRKSIRSRKRRTSSYFIDSF